MLSGQRQKRPGRLVKLLEAGLWLCTCVCGLVFATEQIEAHAAAHESTRVGHVADSSKAPAAQSDHEVIGRLQIRELGISVPVMRDYDSASLIRGVGHVPGTAVPGGLGNLVLAGHRDTFFRPLRGIRPGMEMQVSDARGTWAYQVDGTEIVTPDQVRVLDIGERPEMTLITCYPFEFIGAAPKRFIVHAHLLSADAE